MFNCFARIFSVIVDIAGQGLCVVTKMTNFGIVCGIFFWGRKSYANVFDPVMLRLVNNTATVNKATNLICIYLQGTVQYNRINYRLLTG